jgi:hypothetical protein
LIAASLPARVQFSNILDCVLAMEVCRVRMLYRHAIYVPTKGNQERRPGFPYNSC